MKKEDAKRFINEHKEGIILGAGVIAISALSFIYGENVGERAMTRRLHRWVENHGNDLMSHILHIGSEAYIAALDKRKPEFVKDILEAENGDFLVLYPAWKLDYNKHELIWDWTRVFKEGVEEVSG